VRVTAKGQVTIPVDVRRALGILPGTELSFRVNGDRIDVEKAGGPGRGAEVVRRLQIATGWAGMSTDELMALTRNPAE
jgi:AbrB family looped-hinge helix DNA binding protein